MQRKSCHNWCDSEIQKQKYEITICRVKVTEALRILGSNERFNARGGVHSRFFVEENKNEERTRNKNEIFLFQANLYHWFWIFWPFCWESMCIIRAILSQIMFVFAMEYTPFYIDLDVSHLQVWICSSMLLCNWSVKYHFLSIFDKVCIFLILCRSVAHRMFLICFWFRRISLVFFCSLLNIYPGFNEIDSFESISTHPSNNWCPSFDAKILICCVEIGI